MKTRRNYDTVSEAINGLVEEGYVTDFRLNPEAECLICNKTSLQLSPEDFEIDAVYRFEGDTDPGDEMIVYAISSKKHQTKGLVVNAYGIYSDATSSRIVEHLQNAVAE